ncbi:MAG TPA: SDR family oxidoreductase, partial [Chloroflexia bacterium]|nr:SDR family oxidoreductase [Chloroflexia bacterium]
VGVNYRSEADGAARVVETITTAGGQALAIHADVSDGAAVTAMVEQVVQRFGGLDILVNNAGIEHAAPFLEKSLEDWNRVLAVNLTGPFLCTQAAARVMVHAKKPGTIINISSVHEDLPFPGHTDYCAAKGGLRMLCRNLALELAPYGITVVNVGPGAIATPINRATLEDPRLLATLEHEIPLHRVGEADEVAQLVAYLASDAARYITGTTIFIDGGLMRQTGSL